MSLLCGLSDHNNLVVTVLKSTYTKQKPLIKHYRDWSKFDNTVFKLELREALSNIDSLEYENCEEKFLSLLNLHARMKQKIVCANHKPHMTKALRKAMMKHSELETKYYKSKSEADHRKLKHNKTFTQNCTRKNVGNIMRTSMLTIL